MSEIKTRSEAEKEAQGMIRALEAMPKDAEERESYLESLRRLNQDFRLGLAGEIQQLEEGAEESEAVDPSIETEGLDLSQEDGPKNKNEKDKNGDDDKMTASQKTDYVVEAKNFLSKHLFGGVRVSHIVAAILAALVVIVASSWLSPDDSDLQEKIDTLTEQRDYAQEGWGEANTTIKEFQSNQTGPCDCGDKKYNDTELDAALAEVQSDLDDCQNETGGSAEIGSFDDEQMKDWIAGSLKLQKTTIDEFEIFESTGEALEFVNEVYTWNDAHNLKWNLDELSYAIADEHKRDDPAKAMFFSSKAVYIVLPSEDNIVIPEFYELDENDGEFEFNKVSPSSVSVIAMDKLKESKNND